MTRNSVETINLPEGTVSFDHSTGVTRAKWNNGYTETWNAHREYSPEQAFGGYLILTDQWDRYEMLGLGQ